VFAVCWDLSGTPGYWIDSTVVRAAFVWYSQVTLIVAGHVVAVYLAHSIALRCSTGDPSRAVAIRIISSRAVHGFFTLPPYTGGAGKPPRR
jgi:hypothetical protein